MKIRNFLLLSFFAGIVLTSCTKDDDKKDSESSDPFEAEYSELSITENKENLEQTGVQMLSELNEMKSSEAISVLANFAISMASSMQTVSQSEAFYGVMTDFSNVGSDDFEANQIFSNLKAVSEEPNSFTDLWEMLEGKYTWNAIQGQWDTASATDEIVFEFPGMAGETTNTASLTIDNFAAFTVTDTSLMEFGDTDPELLSSLKITLEYNSTEVASYSFSASYQADGMPTALETVMAMGDFSWSVEITHTPYTAASLKGSFKHSGNVLVEGYIDASGDWSEENVNNSIIEHAYWNSYIEDTLYYTEVMVDEILENSNAYIQIMDIKIAGMVYIDSLGTAIRAIEEDYSDEEKDEEEYATAMAEALNQYALLVVVYAESNEMIAKAVAYPYEDEDGDGDWDVELRFQFADGSPVDAETYFSEGFSDLITEFEEFIGDIEGV
jgi:hypothetical protein